MTDFVAIDLGSSGVRAATFDSDGRQLQSDATPIQPERPERGHVEYNTGSVRKATYRTMRRVFDEEGRDGTELAGVGVTGQRATAVVWDPDTGDALGPALSWQDTRTVNRVQDLPAEATKRITNVTGLVPVSGYAASKIGWLLDQKDRRRRVARGDIMAGSLTSWLIYNLTGEHVIDATGAASTMLCDVTECTWDDTLLNVFDVPRDCLPRIVPSSHPTAYGTTDVEGLLPTPVPVTASLGDQQAALLGSGCTDHGEVNYTLGTGGFLKVATDDFAAESDRLVATVAFQDQSGETDYMLEAPVPAVGNAVYWLVETGILSSFGELDAVVEAVERERRTFVVPAFRGLGAPYWDESASGIVVGVDQQTRASHLVRATVDAIGFRGRDALEHLPEGVNLSGPVHTDGTLSQSETVCRSIATHLGRDVVQSQQSNVTLVGAAKAAAKTTDEDTNEWHQERKVYQSTQDGASETDDAYNRWRDAISVARRWAD